MYDQNCRLMSVGVGFGSKRPWLCDVCLTPPACQAVSAIQGWWELVQRQSPTFREVYLDVMGLITSLGTYFTRSGATTPRLILCNICSQQQRRNCRIPTTRKPDILKNDNNRTFVIPWVICEGLRVRAVLTTHYTHKIAQRPYPHQQPRSGPLSRPYQRFRIRIVFFEYVETLVREYDFTRETE